MKSQTGIGRSCLPTRACADAVPGSSSAAPRSAVARRGRGAKEPGHRYEGSTLISASTTSPLGPWASSSKIPSMSALKSNSADVCGFSCSMS